MSNDKGSEIMDMNVQHTKLNHSLNELQNMKTHPKNDAKANEATSCPTSKKQIIGGVSSAGSALAHLRQSDHANKFDPHKEFCRYELQGKCNDDSCGYQHQYPKDQ